MFVRFYTRHINIGDTFIPYKKIEIPFDYTCFRVATAMTQPSRCATRSILPASASSMSVSKPAREVRSRSISGRHRAPLANDRAARVETLPPISRLMFFHDVDGDAVRANTYPRRVEKRREKGGERADE